MYPPGYRSKAAVKERKEKQAADMQVLMEKKEKMEKERAELVKEKQVEKERAKKKVMEEIRQKAEKEMEEKVRKAMEQAKATWEAEVVEREKEAFRSGWLRGVDKQYRRGGGRRVTGVLAELEWQAEFAKYARGH